MFFFCENPFFSMENYTCRFYCTANMIGIPDVKVGVIMCVYTQMLLTCPSIPVRYSKCI